MGSRFRILISFLLIFQFCKQAKENNLFVEFSDESGAVFHNNLEYTEEFNPYTYRNFYNGGGVALGDINNDGLLDIFFTGNIVDNKLFLNEGNWKFRDITASAGVACPNVWSSGATFADINGDGLLDLYVCKSGKPGGVNRHNELFINNGDLTFTESSATYGLDIVGLSTQTAFFDFDLDGDLDCYLLTNSIRSVGVGYDLVENQRAIPDPAGGGNKLFRNEGGVFKDVSQEMGIYTSAIGFGLGITISDFNDDLYPDIFISNDFFERDYLYINQKGQKFTESLESYFQSISMGSMGADVADLDNDFRPDLMVTEMLPATLERKKSKTVFDSWDKYVLSASKGYYHQFPRNVLQRNIGGNKFVELSRQAGVAATEWSWGSLIFDMNNDGLKDIFIANGIYKDLLDRDYLTYMANEARVKEILQKKGAVIKELIDIIPSNPVPNFAYKNVGSFEFQQVAEEWNLGQPSFSNGSAYGDLDGDGDLDLVVNNVNMQSFVYKNTTDTSINRSLQIRLKGIGENTFGVGATVLAFADSSVFKVENYPSRGFESSVDPVIHIGVGNRYVLDSVEIIWPDGEAQKLYAVRSNQKLEITKKKGQMYARNASARKLRLEPSKLKVPFIHNENAFVDFDRDRLLPQMYHNDGPTISVGDVNGDGLEDLYVGGAKSFTGKVLIQKENGFEDTMPVMFEGENISEDVDNTLFDCDNDGDLDLYVASGGKAFSASSSALLDRIYINDGNGNFTLDPDRLPFNRLFSTSVVEPNDFDRDGDIDLFVGERFHPFYYGKSVDGYLLINDGDGYFSDQTKTIAPGLSGVEMITDALWIDLEEDGDDDLILTCDWGPLRVFENDNGRFSDQSKKWNTAPYTGWWNTLVSYDIDRDGDRDIIAGNHGKNSFFEARTRMYIDDFDRNGSMDYIICHRIGGKYFPIVDRNELVMQLPQLKKQILYFKDYAQMSIDQLFTKEQLENSEIMEVSTLVSAAFINENGQLNFKELPAPFQYAPLYAFAEVDMNGDRIPDLVFGGNQYLVKPQFGRYDAMPVSILIGSNKNLNQKEVVLTTIFGQVRSIGSLNGNRNVIIVGFNNAAVEAYEVENN